MVTIFRVETEFLDGTETEFLPRNSVSNGPIYEAVDVFVDHGSRHFQATPGRPRLADTLLTTLRRWNVAHTIIDASGVGQGLADWLAGALGRERVTAYQLGGAGAKARLGLSLIHILPPGSSIGLNRPSQYCTPKTPERHLCRGQPAIALSKIDQHQPQRAATLVLSLIHI